MTVLPKGSCYSLLPEVRAPQDFSMLTTPPHSPAQPVGGTRQRLHTTAEISSKCVSTEFCKVTPELLFFHLSVPHSYSGAAVLKGQYDQCAPRTTPTTGGTAAAKARGVHFITCPGGWAAA